MLEPAALPRLSVVALAAFCFGLSACGREPETASPPPPAPKAESPPVVAPPPPTLDRAALLGAMEVAAAAYAAGRTPEPDGLSGRRFAIRQAFGCSGPSPAPADPADGLARWSWRGDARDAIELGLTPGDWTGSALVAGAAVEWEAVEGIWLPRPWLPAGGCPGVAPDPLASGPPAPSPQAMGLAAVFEAGGSRLGRRNGRAYSYVVRGKDGRPPTPPADGYRLVLEGRLASFVDGRAIHCRAASPDQRPVCIAAGRLDRVAFEDGAGVVLSEWRPG